jgi:hypothetical protein
VVLPLRACRFRAVILGTKWGPKMGPPFSGSGGVYVCRVDQIHIGHMSGGMDLGGPILDPQMAHFANKCLTNFDFLGGQPRCFSVDSHW